MADAAPAKNIVDLSIGDPRIAGPVLERLVSAAATRAELPVDRVINALTVVDAVIHATDHVIGEQPREIVLEIGSGSLLLRVDQLVDGQAEAIRDAAAVPGVGDVFERTATSVEIESEGARTALVIALD